MSSNICTRNIYLEKKVARKFFCIAQIKQLFSTKFSKNIFFIFPKVSFFSIFCPAKIQPKCFFNPKKSWKMFYDIWFDFGSKKKTIVKNGQNARNFCKSIEILNTVGGWKWHLTCQKSARGSGKPVRIGMSKIHQKNPQNPYPLPRKPPFWRGGWVWIWNEQISTT